MALSQDRNTKKREGAVYNAPLAASAVIYGGALVCLDASGNLVPGSVATTLTAAGRATGFVSNAGGSAGDVFAEFEKGVFLFNNSESADAIARAEIGDNCYIVDDETVAKTNGTNTRSVAGRIMDVDASGVWVQIA